MPSASVVSMALHPPLYQTFTLRPATGLPVSWSINWKRPEKGAVELLRGTGGVKAATTEASPISTVPEPPTITLPCAPTLPSVAAGKPLMNTVEATAEAIGLPQAETSVCLAAGNPSNRTFGEPTTMGLVPWPGSGQAVGSVTRAAGFPLILQILA